MPRFACGAREVQQLLDRYNDRITARVAERHGGRFDIALTVGDLEIAAVRMRDPNAIIAPVLTYTDDAGEPCAIGPEGGLFPLPA